MNVIPTSYFNNKVKVKTNYLKFPLIVKCKYLARSRDIYLNYPQTLLDTLKV